MISIDFGFWILEKLRVPGGILAILAVLECATVPQLMDVALNKI